MSTPLQEEADALAGNADKISLFDDEGKRKSQSTVLVDLCAGLKLFHDADSNCYAIIQKPDHHEVWPIQSRAFKNWLSHEYFVLSGQGARAAAIADALATVEAKALHHAEQCEVFQRVAWMGDRIVIDLCDDGWRVIEIDSTGWRILNQSPVMFTRRTGMAALPSPVHGHLTGLAGFLNVEKGDLKLIIGWLLMAARGRGPYPVLILNGEQGTGKSCTTRALRSCIDPSTVPLRGLTRDVRDILVSATNNHVLVADNLSGMGAEMSDIFCRLATGGGFAERQLYTNREEVLINIQRPIILNGIDEVASRGDLMERAIIIHLPLIKETVRETESSFWKRFDDALPGLLGGLCEALSTALRNQDTVKLERKPRMADFAVWVSAAEPALGWDAGSFMADYSANQDAGVEVALESSPFGEALLKYITGGRTSWGGTATDLLNTLEETAHERSVRSQSWPKSGKGAASVLRRLSPLFRRMGIVIDQQHREAGTGRRIVQIDSSGFLLSQQSHRHKPNSSKGSGCDGSVTQSQAMAATVTPSSHPNPNKHGLCDERDDCDAKNSQSPTLVEVTV